MQRWVIPDTDLEVSALCLGVSGFGTSLRGAEADRLVADFMEAGGNFFDTAHCYAFWLENGLGASEREIGASLRRLGVMERAVVATKGGHPDMGPGYSRPADFLSERVLASDIEESLNRLGMETIPLYFLHRDDGRTPVGEIIERLNREIARGRLRYIAASNWSVERIAAANAYARERGLRGFVASQIQGSLATPNWSVTGDPTTRYITDVELAWHAASGIPIVAYSAAAGGYFADAARKSDLYDSPLNEARRRRAIALSAELRCTPGQIALAYLRHLPARIIPLFSTLRRDHLAEAVGSAEISRTPEQARWLRDGE
jgi:aryl-alcohol dehydrogenase-like predicted oxidoreductase